MTLSNKKTEGMKYELTGHKKASSKQVAMQAATMLGTPSLVWILLKRHKVAILAAGNVILVLNWAVPEWPQIARSLFN